MPGITPSGTMATPVTSYPKNHPGKNLGGTPLTLDRTPGGRGAPLAVFGPHVGAVMKAFLLDVQIHLIQR